MIGVVATLLLLHYQIYGDLILLFMWIYTLFICKTSVSVQHGMSQFVFITSDSVSGFFRNLLTLTVLHLLFFSCLFLLPILLVFPSVIGKVFQSLTPEESILILAQVLLGSFTADMMTFKGPIYSIKSTGDFNNKFLKNLALLCVWAVTFVVYIAVSKLLGHFLLVGTSLVILFTVSPLRDILKRNKRAFFKSFAISCVLFVVLGVSSFLRGEEGFYFRLNTKVLSSSELKDLESVDDLLQFKYEDSELLIVTDRLADFCPPDQNRDNPMIIECASKKNKRWSTVSTGTSSLGGQKILDFLNSDSEYSQLMGLLQARRLSEDLPGLVDKIKEISKTGPLSLRKVAQSTLERQYDPAAKWAIVVTGPYLVVDD